jgi:hypothetical protein
MPAVLVEPVPALAMVQRGGVSLHAVLDDEAAAVLAAGSAATMPTVLAVL